MGRSKLFLPFLLILSSLSIGCSSTKWEPQIKAFEKQDQLTPPPAHPILFVGSSTIRIWKVQQAFPKEPVLNRGFGGSQTDDVLYYFDRIVCATTRERSSSTPATTIWPRANRCNASSPTRTN